MLVFYLIRKLVPYKPTPHKPEYSFESLSSTYARWELITVGLAFIFIPLTGYLIYLLLTSLTDILMLRFDDYTYINNYC